MNEKQPKILILGADGLLGSELVEVLSDYSPIAWVKEDCDLTNFDEIRQKVFDLSPDFIINATGYTAVDKAEEEVDLANKINGEAVGVLAEVAHKLKVPIFHFSTDYVFDGQKTEGYNENDQPNPISAYGRSKYLGEKLLIQNTDQFYLIRLSWLFGRNGKNFIDSIIQKGQKLSPFKVIDDQYGRPTYAKDLALRVRDFIEDRPEYGIYHLSNDGPKTTWYNLAKMSLDLKNVTVVIDPCTTEDYPLPAKRPQNSMLINNKLRSMRDWREAVKEYLASC
ncbi:MAG: dTDP-4-dehydrorhamnose reductase [Patescibacteria group bacterium]